jgi:hypothetical protein
LFRSARICESFRSPRGFQYTLSELPVVLPAVAVFDGVRCSDRIKSNRRAAEIQAKESGKNGILQRKRKSSAWNFEPML